MRKSAMTDQHSELMIVRTAADVHASKGDGDVFSRFDPRVDPDGAAKFSLAAIGRGRARQMPQLTQLLSEGALLGGLEGEPGWSLERRDDGDTMPGYAAWPPGAKYRAYVDPEAYRLPHPEVFYDRAGFHALVGAMLDEFEASHADQTDLVRAVRAKL
jgi:hypothetical protein